MLLRSQLCHLSSALYSNGSSTQQVLCTATDRSQGTPTHTTSSCAAASYAVQVSYSQPGRWAGGASSSSSTSSVFRSAGVICRDAPRPMWAAKAPDDHGPKASGVALSSMITRELMQCDSLVALSDVYNEWGGSFDYINAAAAITKCAKLKRNGAAEKQLLPMLLHCWLQQLPNAGPRQQACANVLWALGKLGTGPDEVWGPTMGAYLGLLQQDVQLHKPQHVSNSLWACAKLRKQPAPDQLQALMQAMLLPEVLAAAETQHLANMVWALGKLCQLEGQQGGVSEVDIQQLLGPQQLQRMSASGKAQEISNVLLGLTYMSTSAAPMVSTAFAQRCSRQLLADTVQRLMTSDSQHVGNAMWACGELGLADAAFLAAAAKTVARCVSESLPQQVVQAAIAYDVLSCTSGTRAS